MCAESPPPQPPPGVTHGGEKGVADDLALSTCRAPWVEAAGGGCIPPVDHPRDRGTARWECNLAAGGGHWRGALPSCGQPSDQGPGRHRAGRGQDPAVDRWGGSVLLTPFATNSAHDLRAASRRDAAGAGGADGRAFGSVTLPPLLALSPSYTLRATFRGKGAFDDPGVIFGPRDALFWPEPPVSVAHRLQPAPSQPVDPRQTVTTPARPALCPTLAGWLWPAHMSHFGGPGGQHVGCSWPATASAG